MEADRHIDPNHTPRFMCHKNRSIYLFGLFFSDKRCSELLLWAQILVGIMKYERA